VYQQPNNKIVTFLPWEEIEPEAQQQILNTSSMPFVFHHVAVMPDCHFGKGATIGTVLATEHAIIPAAVGVDLGCGMIAVRTSLKREALTDLSAIRRGIERRIPMSAGHINNKITDSAQKRIETIGERYISYDFKGKADLLDTFSFDPKWHEALGTLGGGNHFIEICVDENNSVWITLHSGSRGIGNKIGSHFIKTAQGLNKKSHVTLPDRDLAFLSEDTEPFEQYVACMHWAQNFALANREEMMDRVIAELSHYIFREEGHGPDIEMQRINCHHNFAQIEKHFGRSIWVTRKGAIDASEGKLGLIPGSMGTHSYIVSGLNEPLSFHSAPHGAGRKMSRNRARKQFKMKDLEKAMKGIEYRKSDALIDEIPDAYKNIDLVVTMYSAELVKIEHTLTQILNCKGD
jgi:tRNA-splicing ligase RtcB